MFSRPLQNLLPKYTFLNILHTSSSSEIYHVHDPLGNEYALKVFNSRTNDEVFKNELTNCKLLCNAENPDFIRYITSSEDDGISSVKYITFELAEKRSLDNYISSEVPFGETLTKFMFFNIVKMAEKLHKLCFSHRDLNIHNILLNRNYKLKLGGFGSTKYCLNHNGKSVLLFGRVGTPYFMAPEMDKKSYDGKKVDIFSLGVLLLHLRTGIQIFEVHKERVYNYIKKQKYDLFWQFVEAGRPELKLTPEFKELTVSMLNYNYKIRPDITDILQHPWFNDIRNLNSDDVLAFENLVKQKLKQIEKKQY